MPDALFSISLMLVVPRVSSTGTPTRARFGVVAGRTLSVLGVTRRNAEDIWIFNTLLNSDKSGERAENGLERPPRDRLHAKHVVVASEESPRAIFRVQVRK